MNERQAVFYSSFIIAALIISIIAYGEFVSRALLAVFL
jgi:hypothetical protein